MTNWPHNLAAEPRDLILFNYAEGLLSKADQTRLEAHLAVCAECRKSIRSNQLWQNQIVPEFQKRLSDPSIKPSDDFTQRLFRAIAEESSVQKKPQILNLFSVRRWSSVAAAVVFLLGALFIFQQVVLQPQASNQPQLAMQAEQNSLLIAGDAVLPASDAILPASDATNSGLPVSEKAIPETATEGQSRMMMSAPIPAWIDAGSTRFELPLKRLDASSEVITAQTLVPQVVAAIWIESDTLILAVPAKSTQAALDSLEQKIRQLSPECAILQQDELSIVTLLNNRLSPDEVKQVSELLFKSDCDYILLSIGGN